MQALHGDLGLVAPGAADFALAPDQDRAGLGVDEQLRHVRRREDFGKVARVVYNRLEQGMPLQFDSTVNYALKADKEIVTYEDLGSDSPYNTYKHTGLPPAPINSPGLAAMTAAVNPTEGLEKIRQSLTRDEVIGQAAIDRVGS